MGFNGIVRKRSGILVGTIKHVLTELCLSLMSFARDVVSEIREQFFGFGALGLGVADMPTEPHCVLVRGRQVESVVRSRSVQSLALRQAFFARLNDLLGLARELLVLEVLNRLGVRLVHRSCLVQALIAGRSALFVYCDQE